MALAIDAVSSSNGEGTSLSWEHICTGSDLALVVGVSLCDSGHVDISGITYDGVSLTEIRHDSIGVLCSSLWYLDGPATGTNTIEGTFSASSKIVAGGLSLTGFGSIGVETGAIGHDMVTAIVKAAPVADSIMIGNCAVLDGVVATAGSGFTDQWNISEGSSDKLRGAAMSKDISSGGALVLDWALGSATNWAASAVEVKA